MPIRETVISRTAQVRSLRENLGEREAQSVTGLRGGPMTPTTLVVFALLAIAMGFVVLRAIAVLNTYFFYRGKRLVHCPAL